MSIAQYPKHPDSIETKASRDPGFDQLDDARNRSSGSSSSTLPCMDTTLYVVVPLSPCQPLGGVTWPRISPPGLAWVWTLIYHSPAVICCACSGVSVA
jgi:hypothetical protein